MTLSRQEIMNAHRRRLKNVTGKEAPIVEKPPIGIVIVNKLGAVNVVTITPTVETKLVNNEPLPLHFLETLENQQYIIAPILERYLRRKHGKAKAERGIARLKAHLENSVVLPLEDNDDDIGIEL